MAASNVTYQKHCFLVAAFRLGTLRAFLTGFHRVPRSEPGKVLDESSQDLTRKERVQPVRYRGMKC